MAVAFTRTADPAGVDSVTSVATYTNAAIGTAHPDRIVVVCVGAETAATISSCTLGGTAMNAGTAGRLASTVTAQMFYLAYPTGTTATVAVTFSADVLGVNGHICVYNVSDGAYSAKGGDSSSDMDSTDALTTGSVTIATGGGLVAVAAGRGESTKVWSVGGIAEDLDEDAGNFEFTTATSTTAETATYLCTGGTNGEDGALSYLIFNNLTPSSSVSPSLSP